MSGEELARWKQREEERQTEREWENRRGSTEKESVVYIAYLPLHEIPTYTTKRRKTEWIEAMSLERDCLCLSACEATEMESFFLYKQWARTEKPGYTCISKDCGKIDRFQRGKVNLRNPFASRPNLVKFNMRMCATFEVKRTKESETE